MSERILQWTRNAVFGYGIPSGAPLGFYAEHWKPIGDDPHYAALAERYGEDAAMRIALLRPELLREVVYAACGFAYTFEKLEALMEEVQAWVEENVERLATGQSEPGLGRSVAHPTLLCASFEFMTLLGWLRTIDERLERGQERSGHKTPVGLLPSLSETRPLCRCADELVRAFREQALERRLANFILHAEAVPSPLSGASITRDHEVRISVPDRAHKRIGSRDDLTYEEGRDALSVARTADRAVETLVEGLIAGFVADRDAIAAERTRAKESLDVQTVYRAEESDKAT